MGDKMMKRADISCFTGLRAPLMMEKGCVGVSKM